MMGTINVVANEHISGIWPMDLQGFNGGFDLTPPSSVFQHLIHQRDAVERFNPEPNVYYYEHRTEIKKYWIHPKMGDWYRYERTDSVNGLTDWWIVRDDDTRDQFVMQNPAHFGYTFPPIGGGGVTTFQASKSHAMKYTVSEADPNIFIRDTWDASEEKDITEPHEVEAMLASVPLRGNNPIVMENGQTLKTGIGDPAQASHVTVEYKRTAQGVQLVKMFNGTELFITGAAGRSAFIAGSLTTGYRGSDIVWQYAKSKFAARDPRLTAVINQHQMYDPVSPVDYSDIRQWFTIGNLVVRRVLCRKLTADPVDSNPCRTHPVPCAGVFFVNPEDCPRFGALDIGSRCWSEPVCEGIYA